LWNQAVHTDREVTANRPDIITKNKKEKTCTPIDVAILADRYVMPKEAEKKLKYKSSGIEIQRVWNLKCMVIPVIIGATGMVTKRLRKIWKLYGENIRWFFHSDIYQNARSNHQDTLNLFVQYKAVLGFFCL
jgi:hypothetical protein